MEIKIEQLRNELIQALNNSNLPLSLISYILKDTISEVEALRAKELRDEKNALASQQQSAPQGEIDFDSETDI